MPIELIAVPKTARRHLLVDEVIFDVLYAKTNEVYQSGRGAFVRFGLAPEEIARAGMALVAQLEEEANTPPVPIPRGEEPVEVSLPQRVVNRAINRDGDIIAL